MTGKIFRSILTAATTVLLAILVVATAFLYDYYSETQVEQLKDELSLAAAGAETIGKEYLEKTDSSGYRLTWVDTDGTVLFDSQVDASTMENHIEREEIKEAMKNGKGSSSRHSETLTEKTLYEAVRLSDGTVLRISAGTVTVTALIISMLSPIVAIILTAVIISAVLANRMAKSITEPLNKLDLDNPLENDAYEELSPLLKRIHHQQRKINSQLKDLQQKKDEFSFVTENMKEALVLLDAERHILSINSAGQFLFEMGENPVGENFLTFYRKPDMNNALDNAFKNGHSEFKTVKDDKEYSFTVSRIERGGKTVGAVILGVDITEQSNNERMRREFSANVSHELKTPLQSIMGSAELLENNLVKPEDLPRFVGHIKEESSRLVNLVEDIIRLSSLDEGVEMPKEEVSLYNLTEDVFSTLKSVADKKDISLELKGNSGTVLGVRRLLYEVIYNLCDNAVKYNCDGGKVEVTITDTDSDTICEVKDNGIGIPREHQARVFERFYRVDKSHSKKSGGTGLGLSIVKHAVLYHNGKIELKSEESKGTSITVIIPKGEL